MSDARRLTDLLFRRRRAQLTATLARTFGIGRLDLIEDVVQDAFLRALRVWPVEGVPDEPVAWLLTVAKRRALDVIRHETRSDQKRLQIEESILPNSDSTQSPPVYFGGELDDDELRLIFATCHPALSRDSQVALTLRTACGLGTDEIARAFLTTPATIGQRIVRAKRTLRSAEVVLEIPAEADLPARAGAVLDVLYLMFNEGYSVTAADIVVRRDLCGEAIRLVDRLAYHPRVGGPEVHALAALMLFQAARFDARTTTGGEVVPLHEQDRARWDRRLIRQALEHYRRSASGPAVSAFHLEAEIASCHTLSASFDDTPWDRILGCYDDLWMLKPSPIVALNLTVASSFVHGPAHALGLLEQYRHNPALREDRRFFAVEAELLWRSGKPSQACAAIVQAIERTPPGPLNDHLRSRHQLYLSDRGRSLGPDSLLDVVTAG